MRLTRTQLRKVIREAVGSILAEEFDAPAADLGVLADELDNIYSNISRAASEAAEGGMDSDAAFHHISLQADELAGIIDSLRTFSGDF